MTFRRGFVLSGAVCAALGVPSVVRADDILVFAAASLKTVLEELASDFGQVTGHTATFSFAGSSALARQILYDAPADIFISANIDWMNDVEINGKIEPGTRSDLLQNRLVVIQHGKAKPVADFTGLATRLDEELLAMALVQAVPAGIYGKAALEYHSMWEQMAGNVVQTDNVRSALALVASGEVRYGIVYATDALEDDRVSVIWQFEEQSHPPIIYHIADLATRDIPAEQEFIEFLRSNASRHVFEQHGFVVVD